MIIKLGIIGAGWIADKMGETLTGLKNPEIIPYAISSRSLEKAQAFAKQWGFQKAYGSYEEMLCDDMVDLVYIATPHSHHYEHAKMCIEHGKPVLVEKANLKETSLYSLALRCGIPDGRAFTERFIEEERRRRNP